MNIKTVKSKNGYVVEYESYGKIMLNDQIVDKKGTYETQNAPYTQSMNYVRVESNIVKRVSTFPDLTLEVYHETLSSLYTLDFEDDKVFNSIEDEIYYNKLIKGYEIVYDSVLVLGEKQYIPISHDIPVETDYITPLYLIGDSLTSEYCIYDQDNHIKDLVRLFLTDYKESTGEYSWSANKDEYYFDINGKYNQRKLTVILNKKTILNIKSNEHKGLFDEMITLRNDTRLYVLEELELSINNIINQVKYIDDLLIAINSIHADVNTIRPYSKDEDKYRKLKKKINELYSDIKNGTYS